MLIFYFCKDDGVIKIIEEGDDCWFGKFDGVGGWGVVRGNGGGLVGGGYWGVGMVGRVREFVDE